MRSWLLLAVLTTACLCLYGLVLGFAAATAVSGWIPAKAAPVAEVFAAQLDHAGLTESPSVKGVRRAAIGPAADAGSWLEGLASSADLEGQIASDAPSLPPPLRHTVARAVTERAVAWGLNPWLVLAVIRVESDFDPHRVGSAGEIGLMQVLPSTADLVARSLLGEKPPGAEALFDPAWNIRVGTAYLGSLVRAYRGDVAMALSAYNAGDGITSPTAYARTVLAVFRRYAGLAATALP